MSLVKFNPFKGKLQIVIPQDETGTPTPPEDILVGIDDTISEIPVSYILCDELGNILCKDEL